MSFVWPPSSSSGSSGALINESGLVLFVVGELSAIIKPIDFYNNFKALKNNFFKY